MKEDDAPELQRMLIRSLDMGDEVTPQQGPDLAAVRAFLQTRIRELLAHNMEKLINLMYRMDIPEGLFDQAMRLPQEERVVQIAELVLQREFRRLELWKKYSPKPTDE